MPTAMTGAPIDPDAFPDFERAAHSDKAESYADLFAAVTDRAIDPLLDPPVSAKPHA